MNIGLDIRNVGRNRTGDETVFFHLAKWLARVDTRNHYFFLIDRRSEEELSEIRRRLHISENDHASLEVCGSGNKYWWNVVGAPLAMRRIHLDIYHTQYIIPFFAPRYTKIITHIHDVSFAVFPRYIAFKDRLFLRLLIPWSMKHSNAIVAVSEFTKEEIQQHYHIEEEKISVIPNAVSLGNERKREDVVSKYHLPKKYILHVGTLQPRKNIPALIKAYAQVKDQLKGVALVFTGSIQSYHADEEIWKCIYKYQLSDDVYFLGYVDGKDLPLVIQRALVLVSVSLYEGFGLPILEAMREEVAVIASDIVPYREVGGNAVLYVPTEDIAIIANALYSVCTDVSLRRRLVGRGRDRVRLFSWEESARELVEVYERTVKNISL